MQAIIWSFTSSHRWWPGINYNISLFIYLSGFPNQAVVDAYKNPEVNESLSKFSWNEPEMDALRDFLNEKIGWNRDKFNSVVIPVLERFKEKQVQYMFYKLIIVEQIL